MARRKAADQAPPAAHQVIKLDTQGQLSVELDGTAYVLRPSQEAISACEQDTGLSLFDLASLSANARMRIEQIGIVLAALMRAYGKAHPEDPLHATYIGSKPERLAELAYEAGPTRIMAALSVIFAGAINGGYTASGEARTLGS